MTSPPRVGAGLVGVEVPCPSCGVLELIAVNLVGVLTVPDGDTPTLRIKAKSRPLDHDCQADAPASLFDVEASEGK